MRAKFDCPIKAVDKRMKGGGWTYVLIIVLSELKNVMLCNLLKYSMKHYCD